MGLAIVKAPGPKTRVLEPLRPLAKFTPHMPTPIHHGHTEATSAVLCMFFFAAGLEKRRRRKRQTGLPKTIARTHNDGSLKLTQMAQDVIGNSPLNVFENDSGSTGVAVLPNPTVNESKVQRDVIGAFLLGPIALPAWHVLPVFLDLKIAADPALPGLTQDTLPIATTAIFVGWLASATILDKALEVFDQKQLLVLHVIGLLVVVLATVTLPYLTAGNLIVFTAIRFIYGLLMNITALQCIYIQERIPKDQGNQVLVLVSITYCLVTILMAWSCSGLTLAMDWRLETLFWCSAPLILALAVGFPDSWKIVQSLPVAVRKKLRNIQKPSVAEVESGERKNLTFAENRNMAALAVAFLACGCGFYGLTYSAGQLSPDIYMSCMLLHGGDILGYLLALTADKYGRNKVQAFCFFAACICLMLCSTGEPGTPFVLSFAVVGRLCLDVCFTTIYVALAQIFAGRASKVAFTTCETTARLGGIIAPLSGTWPASVSCPLFASFCLAAACCTMALSEGAADVNAGNDEKAQFSKGNNESSDLALVNEETQLFTNVVA
ncbi:unnamed protein product [Cladocopium goreaui]|uniref:Major facilitator superfamily (MFS) profile domain-containing protein n=1 Tax=Cladocopium goreaui TaxID=2562237 RepID=A0A9P1DIT9_9DINO|nr:unnamed protein product [Cladocopium goreaui]